MSRRRFKQKQNNYPTNKETKNIPRLNADCKITKQVTLSVYGELLLHSGMSRCTKGLWDEQTDRKTDRQTESVI